MNKKKQDKQQASESSRLWIRISAALVLAAVVIILYPLTATTKKDITGKCKGLNLMVITLDTMRADRIGAYGYKPAETPNLDRLAANGILFENCYSPVPITLPSHCSVFTGRYPLGHQVRDNGTYFLEGSEITLAEKMKELGFQTYAVIASYVLLAKFGLKQGFDVYDDSLEINVILKNYDSEIKAHQVHEKFNRWFKKKRNPQKKFFAWVHFYDPHDPFEPPDRYKKKFGGRQEDLYNGEVAFTDVFVGKIIDDLKTANLLEQTLVVVLGDHGEAFGEHQEHGHALFCYEQNLKVPLVFYNPWALSGSLQGLRIKNRVSLIDVMPTILELYGQKIQGEIQGESFANLLTGDQEKEERTFYIESMHGKEKMGWAPLSGIIHQQYKYISLPEPELYDLKADCDEQDNLFFRKNRLAKDMDKKLMNLVSIYSTGGGSKLGTRRQLSENDARHLKTLGYISAFSKKTNTNLDPKKGIAFDMKFLEIRELIDRENLDQAESQLQDIKKNNPGTQFPLYFGLMIDILSKKKDLGGIISTCQEAIEAFPKNNKFKINLAFNLLKLGRLKESDDLASELINNNPRETLAYILRGQIAEKKAQISQALGYIEKALALEPQNISLKVSYARLLGENKNYRKTEEICEELLADEDVLKDPKIKTRIGIILTEMHKDDLAFKVLSQLKETNSTNAEALNYLGILYFRKQQYDQALEAYLESIDQGPGIAKTYNNLGTLYLKLFIRNRDVQMRDQAISVFDKALELKPDLESALNGRASAYKFSNRVREALADWKKIIAVKPAFIDAYFNIGITYLQINQKQEALKYLNMLKEKFCQQLTAREQQRLDRLILEAGG